MATPSPAWGELRAGIEQKATFEATVSTVIRLLQAEPSIMAAPELAALLKRVRMLLRSRFTSSPFISKGCALWRAAAEVAEGNPLHTELQQWIAEAADLAGGDQGPDVSGGNISAAAPAAAVANRPAATPYIFEGQLAGITEPPAPGPSATTALLHELMEQMMAATQQEQRGEQQQQGGVDGQQDIPLEALSELEAELLARVIEESAAAGPTSHSAPPASKYIVARLPREQLTAERLVELANSSTDGLQCCVCQSSITVGEDLLALPCKHVYHPDCLEPWLSATNSCPVCRHELPTDCGRYEAQKQAAEEERGRQNAARHNEFLYL